jgi:hypothetical protein
LCIESRWAPAARELLLPPLLRCCCSPDIDEDGRCLNCVADLIDRSPRDDGRRLLLLLRDSAMLLLLGRDALPTPPLAPS